MSRPKLVQAHPLDDEEGPRTGRLVRVEEPTPDPELLRHGFDQVSKVARCDPRLSHRSFRVLCSLEGFCFRDDRQSWVTNRTLGRISGGIGKDAARLALRELEKLGYIRLIEDETKMRGQRIEILYRLKQPERSTEADEQD